MFLIHTRPSRSAAPDSMRVRSTASFAHQAGAPSGAALFAMVTARVGAVGATAGVDATGSSELTIGGFASGAPDFGSGAPTCVIAEFAPGTDAAGARVIAAAMGEVRARRMSLSASRSGKIRGDEEFQKCLSFSFVRFRSPSWPNVEQVGKWTTKPSHGRSRT